MAVILIEAQFRVGPGCAEVPRVILAVMVAIAADAHQMPIPVPDEIIKCLLSLLDEVANRLHSHSAFCLALAFALSCLLLLLFDLQLSGGLSGIVRGFAVGAGTFE